MPASSPQADGPAGSDGRGASGPNAARSSHPRVRPDVIFRQLSDDWVLFDPVSNQIHVLNLAAALVWTSLDGSRPFDEIVRDVADSYDEAPAESVREDVESALERFRIEGLLA